MTSVTGQRLRSFATTALGAANEQKSAEGSADIRARVTNARKIQHERYVGEQAFSNPQIMPRLIRQHCQLDAATQTMLERAITKYGLSAHAYDRILKVSRTIADLAGVEKVTSDHIAEAVNYRTLDRNYWQ